MALGAEAELPQTDDDVDVGGVAGLAEVGPDGDAAYKGGELEQGWLCTCRR